MWKPRPQGCLQHLADSASLSYRAHRRGGRALTGVGEGQKYLTESAPAFTCTNFRPKPRRTAEARRTARRGGTAYAVFNYRPAALFLSR